MSTLATMIAGKVPVGTAKAIQGSYSALTAAGTTTTDAAVITTDIVVVAGASNSGARLPASNQGDCYVVARSGANSIILYPPTGGTINGGASETLATTTGCIVVFTSAIDCIAILGA